MTLRLHRISLLVDLSELLDQVDVLFQDSIEKEALLSTGKKFIRKMRSLEK